MHPVLAQMIAAQQLQQAQQAPRPPSPQELALIEQMIDLERQAILCERMSAAIDSDHGDSVRDGLSAEEVSAFTGQWSEEVLDVCLRAGVTSWEVRRALRTGDLPEGGLVQSLSAFRATRPITGPVTGHEPAATLVE